MYLPIAELSSSLTHDQPLLPTGRVNKANNHEFLHSNWNGWMKIIHDNDAAIHQHIMNLAFTEEERGDMKTFMEKVADGKLSARHLDP